MKKMILLSIVACFGLAVNIFSQTRPLTEEEFYAAVNAADEKRFASSRRETRKDENFTNGELSSVTMITDEYIKPDRQHFVSIEKSGGKVDKTEVISIGKNYYQRKNGGNWEKIKDWYGSGGTMGVNPESKSTFTVEEVEVSDRRVKLYTSLYTYKNEYLDKTGLSFSQLKQWIADDGWLLKEEILVGVLEPKKIVFQRSYNYEFNPKNLKIEAPIVKSKNKIKP